MLANKKKDVLGATRLLRKFQPASVQAERKIREIAVGDISIGE